MPEELHATGSATRAPRLGPLEEEVLEHLFEAGPHDVVGMQTRVGRRRGRSKNTIHSTLERLVRKGLATRTKRSRSFVYSASLTRGEWMARRLTALIPDASDHDPSPLLATFVDVAERAGEDQLAELERLVRARRRALESGPGSDGEEEA